MKTWIIITLIGVYFALGIVFISLLCKFTDTGAIDMNDGEDVSVTGLLIIVWPLVLIVCTVIVAFRGLSICINIVLKAFNNK